MSATHSDGLPIQPDFPVDDYKDFLTQDALNKAPSEIHELVPLEETPGILSLLAGKPNIDTYPYTDVQFSVKDPFDLEQDIRISLNGAQLAEGLQYGATPGFGDLLSWFYELQRRVHGRERNGNWRISIGCGSRELVSKAIRAMIEPGDPILVDKETTTFLDHIPIFRVHPCEVVQFEVHNLEDILKKRRIKVLYTRATPRRADVFDIARKYGTIILEHAQFPCSDSYFSLDQAGTHVVRFDTLSNVLGAGLSIGWMSGPVPLLNAVDTYSSTANLQAASFNQAVTLAVLTAWGHQGFLHHIKNVTA